MPQVAYIIQAREASRRFPDKWKVKINGKNVLDILINTVLKSTHCFGLEQITFIVPVQDKRLTKFIKDKGIKVVHDEDRDVYQAFLDIEADIKVRLTADSPMIHWMEIDKNINKLKDGYKYASNEITKFGNACEAFYHSVLVKHPPQSASDSQHVTLAIRRESKETWIPSFMLDYPESVKYIEDEQNQRTFNL